MSPAGRKGRGGGSGPRERAVLYAALGLISLGMLAPLGRVVQLQTSPPSRLEPYMRAGVRTQTLQGVRGDILDARGRVLSTTRFATRLVIDPHLFPADPHEAIVEVCEAAGLDPGEVGARILRAQAENLVRAERRRLAEAAGRPRAEGPGADPPVLMALVSAPLGESAVVESGAEADEAPARPLPTSPIRYTPVSGVLGDEQVEALAALRVRRPNPIGGLVLERVPVREYPGGPDAAAIVGLVGFGDEGTLGAEASHEASLGAQHGRVRFVQHAGGAEMWIDPSGFRPAARGQDVRLSIDLEIQRMAMEELRRGVEDADAAGGRIVVLDPMSGAILAMGDVVRPIPGSVPYPWSPVESPQRLPPPGQRPRYKVIPDEPLREAHPALSRLRCVVDSYEPGSTFKPFVWAIALSHGVVRLDEVIDTGGGQWRPRPGRLVTDVRSIRAASRSWHDVLVFSSNVGMSRVALRVPSRALHDALDRWGFGRRLDVGMPYQARGRLTAMRDWRADTTVSVSFGYEVLVTPLHMVRAFSAFARDGALAGTIPTVSITARPEHDPHGVLVERVLTPEAALMVRAPLTEVARRMERHVSGTPAGGWRYRIFGKSGTANVPLGAPPAGHRRPPGERGYYENQYFSSFIAAGPTESPRLVVLCIIDDPGPSKIRVEQHYGSYVAGPVVRRFLERGLEYLGVPPSPPAPIQPGR